MGETMETVFLCAFYKGPSASDYPVKLKCDIPINGRYVKIQRRYRTEKRTYKVGTLKLCEVEVYARVVKGMKCQEKIN